LEAEPAVPMIAVVNGFTRVVVAHSSFDDRDRATSAAAGWKRTGWKWILEEGRDERVAAIFPFGGERFDGEMESDLFFLVFPVEVSPSNIRAWDLASRGERRTGRGVLPSGGLVNGEAGNFIPCREEPLASSRLGVVCFDMEIRAVGSFVVFMMLLARLAHMPAVVQGQRCWCYC